MNAARLRSTLRLARRDVAAHKARSSLIVAMICLPLAIVAMTTVVIQSSQLSESQQFDRLLGNAETKLEQVNTVPIQQKPNAEWQTERTDGSNPERPPVQLSQLLPEGARVVQDNAFSGNVDTVNGTAPFQIRQIDLTSDLAAPVLPLKQGRSPVGPDEVAINDVASERTGASIGETIRVGSNDEPMRVTGVIENPRDLRSALVAITPSAEVAGGSTEKQTSILTDAKVDWSTVKAWNQLGVLTYSKSVLADPPPSAEVLYQDRNFGTGNGAALVALLASMAILEVALLAGTAFAVGARRQRRTLALLLASGGTSKDIRRVILGGAVVLGVVAVLGGLVLGVASAHLGRPLFEQWGGARFGSFDVRPADIVAIAATGLLASVGAAALPGVVASRMNVVAALSGKGDPKNKRARILTPLVGLIVTGLGLLTTGYGASGQEIAMVMLGSIVAIVGLIFVAPTAIRFTSKIAHVLPFGPRMALRDSARNTGRTAPAVAAIMAGVAGAIAISMAVTSMSKESQQTYQPVVNIGDAYGYVGASPGDRSVLESAMQSALPVDRVENPDWVVTQDCVGTGGVCSARLRFERTDDPSRSQNGGTGFKNLVVADGQSLEALTGSESREMKSMLDAGGVVVFDSNQVVDGKATLVEDRLDADGAVIKETRRHVLPAVLVTAPDNRKPDPLIGATTVTNLGLARETSPMLIASTTREPTQAEEERFNQMVQGISSYATIERGYEDPYKNVLLGLTLVGIAIAFLATGMSTGLALADSSRDQSTLAAVGAPPRMRKRTTAFSAGVIAVLGGVFGVLAGLIPGAAFAWLTRSPSAGAGVDIEWLSVVPWPTIGGALVIAPLLGASCAWFFTRSNVQLTHRAQ